MGNAKARAPRSARTRGRRSGTRVLIFSAAAAAGVLAVQRSRSARSSTVPASFDELPHLPAIPSSTGSVATSVSNAGVNQLITVADPNGAGSIDAQPETALHAVAPAPLPVSMGSARPESEAEDEGPPIWESRGESAHASAEELEPASALARTGAPASPVAPLLILPVENLAETVGEDGLTGVGAHQPEGMTGNAVQDAVQDRAQDPAQEAVPPVPSAQTAGVESSGGPAAAAPVAASPRHAHVAAPALQDAKPARSGWSRTPMGRRILAAVGLVVLAALIVATVIFSTRH